MYSHQPRYALKQITPPTTEPVTLDQFKLSQRIDWDDEDVYLESALLAARLYVERACRKQFVTATWRASWDCFPLWQIDVPLWPLQSVSAITYVDWGGNVNTVSSASYLVDTERQVGRITPVWNGFWPIHRPQINTMQVTFMAGFGAASAVPELDKKTILALAGHWVENREPFPTEGQIVNLPFQLDSLLQIISSGMYP